MSSSFRDPAGRLRSIGDRLVRSLTPETAADLLLDTPVVQQLVSSGRLVATRRISDTELEHERIPFPSYPHEWPPEMLAAAAELTLDLNDALLAEGLGLKDATPLNVLFRGPDPVFVDFLSIERRDPLDPIWKPYAQFVRTFALPLLAAKKFGFDLRRIFETSREGLSPEEVYRMTGPVQRLLPPFLSLVTLPTWLTRRERKDEASVYQPRAARSPDQARYMLEFLFRRLRRLVRSVAPASGDGRSVWTEYASARGGRSAEVEFKVSLVSRLAPELGWQRVLDIGCNTGYVAVAAAHSGAQVVAIDSDPAVVGMTWHRARSAGAAVLPLVVDITRPSPALGWRNAESLDFLSRARGHFDAVLMFGVIHHMLVTERIPLEQIFDLVGELTTRGGTAIIEHVPPEDPFFRRITRGRDALYQGLTLENFQALAAARFATIRTWAVPGTGRTVFLLEKK